MDHASPLSSRTIYTFDNGRLTGIRDDTSPAEQPADPADLLSAPSSSFTFTHDEEKQVFLLTRPGGKTEVFRDNPRRYLSVAPDPRTREMKPVPKYGRPTYLWLCREEPEVR
jgi:hypothetical protein